VVGHVATACSLGEVGFLADATVCTANQVICGGACTSLDHDNGNCGSCGIACGAGQLCSQGKCGTSCGGGTTQCGDSCVELTVDPNNCGSCGNFCGIGSECVSGKCASSCGTGQTLCQTDAGVS
jgi:hypothetical protein